MGLVAWSVAAAAGAVVLSHTIVDPLVVIGYFSVVAGFVAWRLIPLLSDIFFEARLAGNDVNKAHRPLIPESLGIVVATIYLMALFLFIPFPFKQWFAQDDRTEGIRTFPFQKLGEFLAALLCLQSMVFLGFADDVFNIRWRYKLLMPTVASVPLLMGYYLSDGVTYMIVPLPFRPIFGQILNIGILYYVYIVMLTIFCTNSINILAGINGVEAGQSLIIAISIAINDLLYVNGPDKPAADVHLFSLYFMLPFIAVTTALLWHNWYPARVFVGDTYCYFAGMTFAVVGIVGHFSKTVLLMFIPQIVNFIYSTPQLFHIIPCPRHRLPRLNPETGLLEPSRAPLQELSPLGHTLARLLNGVGLTRFTYNADQTPAEMTNLTLLNLILIYTGPLHEQTLAGVVMALQVIGSGVAFTIRYKLVHFFY
ncbi:tunicamycin resistance protein [Dimargaris cristalligena]|uniref:UDP-N-acetylglucosamine--dolichyl-phosphate N-acetylglucosaminephosphotransferase n=1 Tax=Dimargaris cristalligena TaxID=215637 RepID=A0A4P9ZTQ0_9FUNG|nr:tunicamycin resistance protein [Dimargaris cristalligena]RKP36966.1 glycosyl transferase family 4-domain-containing protein [Dimargaris cristalligena]|eukprot:RKP36966.1 glycosyl transferase family 4-domain-containing protein [Dimargaris cristalligena]